MKLHLARRLLERYYSEIRTGIDHVGDPARCHGQGEEAPGKVPEALPEVHVEPRGSQK